MKYYERMINQTDDRPILMTWDAVSRINELEAEVEAARKMIDILKAVIREKDLVIRAAALGGRL